MKKHEIYLSGYHPPPQKNFQGASLEGWGNGPQLFFPNGPPLVIPCLEEHTK